MPLLPVGMVTSPSQKQGFSRAALQPHHCTTTSGFGQSDIVRGKDQIWFMSITSTLALKWWWVAMLGICPVPRESRPPSLARDPGWFCGCCLRRQICSSHFMTSANLKGVQNKGENGQKFFISFFLLLARQGGFRVHPVSTSGHSAPGCTQKHTPASCGP